MSDDDILRGMALADEEHAERVNQARESVNMLLERILLDMIDVQHELDSIEDVEWTPLR